METLTETLSNFGGDPAAVLEFVRDGPELLPYATLVAARASEPGDFAALAGIYEWQGRPLLVLVDGVHVGSRDQLRRIRRAVAMRGDAPYLGVVFPGQLIVYQIGLDDRRIDDVGVSLPSGVPEKTAAIPYLANLRPGTEQKSSISEVVLRLLTGTIDELVAKGTSDNDAISLVGRALFVRFLADRGLIGPRTIPQLRTDPDTFFDSVSSIKATTAWLDKTFNGDFLPLSSRAISSLNKQAVLRLGDVLRRAPDGQLSLGWQEKWDTLDFSQIPVGVLSQAYERYLSRHDPEVQKQQGGYYTPRHIADLMVRGSFQALRRTMDAHECRVLDPAAGAGVFLITSFRQLVAEYWRHTGRRPDTKVLRGILYNQICGFDINESALRFAALGLYLISIELDPNPEPLEKLRFSDLRPKVLRKFVGRRALAQGKVRTVGGQTFELGSLGPDVGPEHIAAYDLVIGNPPWASATRLGGWDWLQDTVTAIARDRTSTPDIEAPIPNEVLDIPFLWRSTQWCRVGGQITFALHARILFQQGETMPAARSAIFRAIDVTGVINGAELRATRVWPEITAPFCLLFATNRSSQPGSGFRFVTPRLDPVLNQNGTWRVDATNAALVTTAEVLENPTLLKTLFRGTRLDLDIFDRIAASGWPNLGAYWRDLFGTTKGRPRFTGNGYQNLRPSSRVRRNSDDRKPGVSAQYLWKFRELSAEAAADLEVDSSRLRRFRKDRIHDPRPEEIFKGPLLIVRESPPVGHGRIRVSVSAEDVVYNQSYHGYSAHQHRSGPRFTKYLALVIGSRLALWHALITSGRFGFEREVVEKFIIDEMPVPPFESLTASQQKRVDQLFAAAARNEQGTWRSIDAWVASVYGLSSGDVATISDTLRFNLPFSENRKRAQAPPTESEKNAFCSVLRDELSPWAAERDADIYLSEVSANACSPWHFVFASSSPAPIDQLSPFQERLIELADHLCATEIVVEDRDRFGIWLGRLNQARYWSRSAAKIVARQLIWDYPESLFGDRPK